MVCAEMTQYAYHCPTSQQGLLELLIPVSFSAVLHALTRSLSIVNFPQLEAACAPDLKSDIPLLSIQ